MKIELATKSNYLKLVILASVASAPYQSFAGDLDAFSLIDSRLVEQKRGFIDSNSDSEPNADEDDGKLKIEPKISAEGNSLSPSLSFTTRKKAYGTSKAYLGLTASSKPSLDDPIELAKSYVVDGGDVNFNLGWTTLVMKTKNLVFDINTAYSLYSGDEFSTETDTTIDIESEILRLGAGFYYDFNAARIGLTAAHHSVNNEEDASEFSKIIDGKTSYAVGISIPFTMDEKNVYLKFLRTEIEDLDSVDFRVSIEMSL